MNDKTKAGNELNMKPYNNAYNTKPDGLVHLDYN